MLVRFDVGHYGLDRVPDLDAVVCAVALDERPLRGLAGLADWRLCGLLSKQLLEQRYGGRLGEDMLVASRPRLPFDKLFLLGLGRIADLDAALARQVIGRAATVLLRAGVTSAALGLWDLTRECMPYEEGFEALLEGLSLTTTPDDRTLDLYLLARSPTETGRMVHHLDGRLKNRAPTGIELARLD